MTIRNSSFIGRYAQKQNGQVLKNTGLYKSVLVILHKNSMDQVQNSIIDQINAHLTDSIYMVYEVAAGIQDLVVGQVRKKERSKERKSIYIS